VLILIKFYFAFCDLFLSSSVVSFQLLSIGGRDAIIARTFKIKACIELSARSYDMTSFMTS